MYNTILIQRAYVQMSFEKITRLLKSSLVVDIIIWVLTPVMVAKIVKSLNSNQLGNVYSELSITTQRTLFNILLYY